MTTSSKATAAYAAIPLGVALGWAIGSLGMATLFQAVTVLLLRYMTDYLGIAAATAGLMIGASKIFDGLIDPMIGIASDRTKSRWGRRRPYLIAGGILSALSFWLMFHPPAFDGTTQAELFMLLILLLFAGGYALFNIPYLAMPPEMSDSPQARTKLISYRVSAVALGSILAAMVGPMLISAGGGGAAGHSLMASVVAAIVLVTSIATFFGTSKARFTDHAPKTDHSFKSQVKLALENRPFVSLAAGKLLQLTGSGITVASTPFIFTQLLGSTYAMMGTFILVKYVAMIVSQPFWVWVCGKWGKRNAFLISVIPTILVNISWLFADAGDPMILTMLRGVALGFLGGASLLTIQALLPDTIQYDFQRTGLRREGVYAGVYTTIEKFSAAIASALIGMVLGAFGYVSSTGANVQQSESAIQAIYLIAVLPAATIVLAGIAFWTYRLDERQLAPDTPAPVTSAKQEAITGQEAPQT